MNLEDHGLTAEEILSLIPPHIRAKNEADAERVRQLCEDVGYGFVMNEASRLWQKKDFGATGAFAVGPCVAFTEPCGCKSNCDDCYGCGWVFKKSKQDAKQGDVTVCSHPDNCQQCGGLLRLLTKQPDKTDD